MTFPPTPFNLLQYRKNLCASDGDKWNDGRLVSEGNLDKIVPQESAQSIGVAVERKRSLNAFGKDPENLVTFKNTIGILLACDHPADLGHEVSHERKLHQARVQKESRTSSGQLQNLVNHYYSIPGHEATVQPDQHHRAFARQVFQAPKFHAPIVVLEKVEERSAECFGVVLVETEIIESNSWQPFGSTPDRLADNEIRQRLAA